jgi:outer membrane protein insertion porin family
MLKKILLFVVTFICFSAHALDTSKTIDKITIKGLVKNEPRLVRSYLPVIEGDKFSQEALKDITKSLFASDFFRDVKLYQNGGELIIELVERPWISKVIVSGNKLIEEEQLMSVLETQNIIENRAFNQEKFQQIISEIENLYYLQGYYGVKIAVENTPLDNQRVSLRVQIFEGDITKIARINLIGNKTYKQEDLLRTFRVRVDSPNQLFNNNDSYVKASLEGDLQTLSNFYLDRGYVRFRILDRQVSLLPDKAAVFINVHLEEGEIYHFSDISVNGYEKVLTDQQVMQLMSIKKGKKFSRKNMVKTVDDLRKKIQSYGYAFAQVEPIVRIKDDTKEVFVSIQINIQQRVYVRRIVFSGNNITLDRVVRLEMRQFEQALYIPSKVDISRRRINRLGFFSKVDIRSNQVSDNQVDLLIKVSEQRTGSLNLKLGYSPQSGAIYEFSIAENNWLGRGYQAKIDLNIQENSEAISLNFNDKNFFEDDISLLWNISYQRRDDANISDNSYKLDRFATNLGVGIPITENVRFNYGFGLAREDIECGGSFITCGNFIDEKGKAQESVSLTFSSNWDLRNRGFLPSSGSLHNFSSRISLPEVGLSYYTSRLTNQFFGSLSQTDRSTVRFKTSIDFIQGYNGDKVPFYKKLFVGGAQTVRGYGFSSLGPKYVKEIDGISGFKGGDIRAYANLDFYIAIDERDEFSNTDDNFRLNLFFDSGYAFESHDTLNINAFRSSVGVGWVYFSPIGIIIIYYGVPVNQIDDDEIDQFGFTIRSSL